MPASRSRSLLVDAARLYYVDGLGQGEISRRLGVSRSNVSRILAAAREQGIVEVRIHDDNRETRRVPELEAALTDHFEIREVHVAGVASGISPLDQVTQLAARVFEDRAPDATRIGLSWGATVAHFVDELQPQTSRRVLEVMPLVGGLPTGETGRAGNLSILTLARKVGASPRWMQAPAVVESKLTHDAMMHESSIIDSLEYASNCDLAFVGIGSFGVHTSRRVITAMRLSDAEEAQLLAANPVGDICGRFFDVHGQVLGPPASDRVIGLTLDQLSDIETLVGMASGKEKAPGVAGALRTGVLDVLVIDEELAMAVIHGVDSRPAGSD